MKLITWNVQWFCGLDGQVSLARVLDEACAMADFDVLCLQEVAVHYPQLQGNAGFDQAERLRELLAARRPGFDVFFGAAVDECPPGATRQRFGNLIASRLPVLQVQHYPLPYPADGGVNSMPRMATVATVQAAFGPVRVMTTHLEYFSARQRLAQAQALLDLHAQACAHASAPPLPDLEGPFQAKPHTRSAIVCGDFNCGPNTPEHALLQATPAAPASALHDAWQLLHGDTPQPPTFRVFDKRYGPEPICCDFVFVSDELQGRVQAIEVNSTTQASDHQPVLLVLDADSLSIPA